MDAIGKIEYNAALGKIVNVAGRAVGIDFFGFREPYQRFSIRCGPPVFAYIALVFAYFLPVVVFKPLL